MNYISRPVPIHFYQVKSPGTTIEQVAEKYNVNPKDIQRENPDSSAELSLGEMLVIKLQ